MHARVVDRVNSGGDDIGDNQRQLISEGHASYRALCAVDIGGYEGISSREQSVCFLVGYVAIQDSYLFREVQLFDLPQIGSLVFPKFAHDEQSDAHLGEDQGESSDQVLESFVPAHEAEKENHFFVSNRLVLIRDN